VIVAVGRPKTLFMVNIGGLSVQLILMLVLVPNSLLGVELFGLKGLGAAVQSGQLQSIISYSWPG
jgi:hypothetical protein